MFEERQIESFYCNNKMEKELNKKQEGIRTCLIFSIDSQSMKEIKCLNHSRFSHYCEPSFWSKTHTTKFVAVSTNQNKIKVPHSNLNQTEDPMG